MTEHSGVVRQTTITDALALGRCYTEHANDLILVIDAGTGEFLHCNAVAERLLDGGLAVLRTDPLQALRDPQGQPLGLERLAQCRDLPAQLDTAITSPLGVRLTAYRVVLPGSAEQLMLCATPGEEALFDLQLLQSPVFLHHPSAIYVDDLSGIVSELQKLPCDSPEALDAYFTANPGEVLRVISHAQVLAVNDAALELTGAPDAASFISGYVRLLTPASLKALQRVLVEMVAGKTSISVQLPIINWDGEPRVLQLAKRYVDPQAPRLVINTLYDISHWLRAEEAFGREQHTLMGSPVYSFRWRNAEGWPVESVSPNIEQLGFSRDDLLSGRLLFAEVVYEEDLPRVGEEVMGYVVVGRDAFEQEYRIRCGDGVVRWFYDFTTVVRDEKGDITHFDGILLDITHRKETEQALRISERRYHEMFQTNAVSLWVEDLSATLPIFEALHADGVEDFDDFFARNPDLVMEIAGRTRVLDVNDVTLAMFDARSKEELLGSLDRVFTAESLPGSIAINAALARGDRQFEVETVNRTLTGRRIDVLIKMNLTGQPDYQRMLVSMVDITERKAIEEQLRASERELSTILNNMQDTFYRTDREGRLNWVNQSGESLLGYAPDEAVGLPMASLYYNAGGREDFLQTLQSSGGRVKNYHGVLRHRDGHKVYVSTNAQYYFDDNGNVLGVEGTTRDITQQVEAEQALTESRRALSQANRIAKLGHFEWNIETNQLLWSPEIYEILGVEDSELTPDAELFISHVIAEDRERVMREMATAAQQPGTYSMRYAIHDSAGRRKYLEAKGEVSDGTNGRRMLGYVRDISEERKLEETLRKARDVAEQANRLKSDFLANMSHEIRTPMNGISGFVNLLSRTTLSPLQREYLDTIKTSLGDLLTIVNDILDFSRVESGKLEIRRHPFDLQEAVTDVVSLFSSAAVEKGLGLSCVLNEGINNRVEGDPVRLRQVLGNLLGNAIKFTMQGGVELHVTVLNDGKAEQCLRFEVFDSGSGIDTLLVERLFDAFVQSESAVNLPGTGLGLAISKRLVELMGGCIGAHNHDTGACFWFELPMWRCFQSEVAKAEGGVAARGVYNGRRVLVVDDNRINRKLISTLLGDCGVTIVEAEDGYEAIDHALDDSCDLVLMDIRMPTLDGLEATRRIRSRENGERRVPIIALTAHALPHEQEQFRLAGMDDVLTKPVSEQQLWTIMQRCLGDDAL